MFNIKKLLWVLLPLTMILVILGAYFKITHNTWADIFIEIALIFFFIYFALCIYGISKAKGLTIVEKWLYVIAVIFLPLIGGIIFLLDKRVTL